MKWLYHCTYCGDRTLDAKKQDSMPCRFCEHPATRMQSTIERVEREGKILEITDEYDRLHPKQSWWSRFMS